MQTRLKITPLNETQSQPLKCLDDPKLFEKKKPGNILINRKRLDMIMFLFERNELSQNKAVTTREIN